MTEQTERERLEALWLRVHREAVRGDLNMANWPKPMRHKWHRFTAMLDVGAYESAALMLVPRGWIVTIHRQFDEDGCFFSVVELVDSFSVGRGCDPEDMRSVMVRKGAVTTFHDPTALALCAAIEAAIAQAGEHDPA